MGKKGKGGDGDDAVVFAQKAASLRSSADKLFATGKLADALAMYEQALTLTPDKCAERALIHANRAACFLRTTRLSEAVQECTAALEAEPGYERALLRRARAFELAGALEKAVADLELASKAGSVEATRTAMRLRSLISEAPKGPKNGPGAKSKAGARPGASALAPAGAAYGASSAAARPRPAPTPSALSSKVTLDGVCKTVSTPLTGGYPELLAAACAAFPSAGPLALRFLDGEGDNITINSRADVKLALHTAVQRHVREVEEGAKAAGPNGPKLSLPPGALPPLHITASRVEASPKPPMDEVDAPAEPAEDIVEIDEWMLDLSAMFRARLALAEGETVDMRVIGVDKCCEVLEEVIATPEAQPHLDGAAAKFQEAAAAALYNWGNVHTCVARKRVDASANAAAYAANEAINAEGPEAEGRQQAAVEAAVEHATAESLPVFDESYAAACERWTASLAVKPDFYEALLAWGQQAFERAKLLSLRAKEAPPRATAKEVDAAFAAAADKFRETLSKIPAEEAKEGAAPTDSQSSNVQILLGNVLFEQSQVAHARGDAEPAWRKLVDSAVERFKAAGCPETDITRALEGHPSGAWKPTDDAAAAVEA